MKRVTLCRGEPACPPILVGTWSAVYPVGEHAGPTLHELHQHDNTTHQTHTEGPRRGPTNHSRGSKEQSPERPTEARRHLIYRPLVGRTRRIYNLQSDLPRGEVVPPCTPLCPPPVVRSFAPSTGGYDSSDRKRSSALRKEARLLRPLYNRLRRQGFNGDGRTDRASLQDSVTASIES